MKDMAVSIVIFVFLVALGFVFISGIQQAKQDGYQEGLRAGKASAQVAAYDQGYEKGYASAMYEVG